MGKTVKEQWAEAQELHSKAVSDFTAAVIAVPVEMWEVPATEKWSPAHILEHVSLAYDILLSELSGGPGMQLKTKGWQRILLRWTMVPRILRGGAFPRGARAPRETRPGEQLPSRDQAIASFLGKAKVFEQEARRTHRERPGVGLTHAYFGTSSLTEGVIFCARHLQHHAKQIRDLVDRNAHPHS